VRLGRRRRVESEELVLVFVVGMMDASPFYLFTSAFFHDVHAYDFYEVTIFTTNVGF
jgi:hypothetical protein